MLEQIEALRRENDGLRAQLEESQEILRAIRSGEVDALIVSGPEGDRIFTLTSAEQTYRILIEQMREGAATLARDGMIHYANRALADMLRRPLEKVIGQSIQTFVAAADEPALAALLAQGEGRRELTLRAEGRENLPVQVSASLLPIQDPAELCLVITDLTERKHHEARILQLNEELEQRVIQRTAELQKANLELASEAAERKRVAAAAEQQRQLLAVTLASIGDAVIVTDAQGRVTFLNAEAERLTGWASQEAAGQPLPTVFHIINEETRQEVENPVDKVVRLGTVVGLANHTVLIARDGRETPIDDSAALIRQRDGTFHGVVLVFRDFTEAKQAEKALRDSVARFRTLADAIPQLAWTAHPDGYIHWYNRRWYEYTGTTPQRMEGWGWQSVHDPELLPKVMERWKACIAAGEPFEMEYPLRGADGLFRRFLTRVMPLKDTGGRVVQWFGTHTDVEELKQAEDALQHAKQGAEAASRAKDHFLAVLSHELRTPLTPVLAAVSMLQAEPGFDAETRENLEMVRRNVELEARLIDDLLDISRIERGKVELNRQSVDLCTIIRRAVEVCRPDIEARRLDFGVDISSDAPYLVHADSARLQQVFWNLLKNAVKFTAPGGCVSIRCRLVDGYAVAEVNDSGVGIEPEVLPRLFTAFQQAERSITRRFGGLGLGLAISKALVEMHGGSIEAHSEGLGKGATFRLRLPLASTESKVLSTELGGPSAASQRDSGLRTQHSGLRVLLVEDHSDSAKIIKRLLERRGYEVETAGDVATALELAGQGSFDLLVSDLGLPDRSGVELIRELRSRGVACPAIALSGYGQEEDVQRSREAGFNAHITKPVNFEQLYRAITATIENT